MICPRAVPPQTGGPLLFVSDLPSWGESREQRFGVGDAGFALKRILGLAGIDESETSISSIRCSREPHPGDCDRRLPLPGSPRVIVALGEPATRILTSFPRHEKATMTELHGHVIPSTLIPGALVVPCFPPENLGKGSANLTGVVVGDLRRARALSRALASRPGLTLPSPETGDPWYTNCPDLLPALGMQPEPELICDPPLAWFDAWVESLLAAISERGGKAVWLAVDIETLHSGKSLDAAAVAGDPSYTILRINFASHPDEGITVPFTGAYESAIRRVLASPCTKVLWNWRFDIRRLQHAGFEIGGRILDAKDWWHALQSDMGGGDDEKEVGSKSGAGSVKGNSLGFVAPLLAPGPAPWKHLGEGETAAAYAAKDVAMTLRIAFALEDRLRAESMLSVARVHLSAFDQYAIGPAEEVGLGVDREALVAFQKQLLEKEEALALEVEALAPEGVGGLQPPQGWSKEPQPIPEGSPQEGPRVVRYEGGHPIVATEINAGGVETHLEGPLVVTQSEIEILSCATCGATDVIKNHRCKERYTITRGARKGETAERPSKSFKPALFPSHVIAPRYHLRLPFNPKSSTQMKAAILAMGLSLGKDDTADKLTLRRLHAECLKRASELKTESKKAERSRRADFFSRSLSHREIAKIEGTYATGTLLRLAAQEARGLLDGRLHPSFSNNPSMMRTACKGPNLQNVASDRAGEDHPAAGFRRVVVAAPGHWLVEADFSAIEAVLLGYFANDPTYYRFAKLGIHAFMASQMLAEEGKWERIDETWDDDRIRKSADALKASTDQHVSTVYTGSKRTIHMTGFGGTPRGMVERMPELFPNVGVAQKFQDFYFRLAPKVRACQLALQELASREHCVGGSSHPFRYRHFFYDVARWIRVEASEAERARSRGLVTRRRGDQWYVIRQGEDAKRVIAFMPQSTAAGIMRLCALRLFAPPGEVREELFGSPDAFADSYIGDAYGGKTPLRAIIHDSFLLEIPDELLDSVIARVLTEMRRPVPEMPLPWSPGEHLTLDAAVKIGRNWAPASEHNPEGMRKWKPTVASPSAPAPSEAALDVEHEPDTEDEESAVA